jgi:hypothetical protein
MKKIIWLFGIIIGILLTTNSMIMISKIYSDPDFKGNDVLGYTVLIIIFSVMYLGMRKYRNEHLEGKISFLNAFKTGAWICFIASTIYVVIGLLYYYLFIPDFVDVFSEVVIRNSPAEEVDAVTAQMANFKEMYKNPLFAILISYIEVLPLGMIVALVSAFVVKRK